MQISHATFAAPAARNPTRSRVFPLLNMEEIMKTKIILGIATLATLALPAVAQDRYSFRDHRDARVVVVRRNRDRDQFLRERCGGTA